jgi:hypothetical protein
VLETRVLETRVLETRVLETRVLETRAAWMAATIARRSRPEFGHSGLAAQQGFLSPEALIQKWTGSSKGDAQTRRGRHDDGGR